MDNRNWYIWVLGSDLLKGRLPNDNFEAYEYCQKIYDDFIRSEFNTDDLGEYDCLLNYLNDKGLLKSKSVEQVDESTILGLIDELNEKIKKSEEYYEKSFGEYDREDAEVQVSMMMEEVLEIGRICERFKDNEFAKETNLILDTLNKEYGLEIRGNDLDYYLFDLQENAPFNEVRGRSEEITNYLTKFYLDQMYLKLEYGNDEQSIKDTIKSLENIFHKEELETIFCVRPSNEAIEQTLFYTEEVARMHFDNLVSNNQDVSLEVIEQVNGELVSDRMLSLFEDGEFVDIQETELKYDDGIEL